MLHLTFLGTSNAVPDVDHDNTHLAVTAGERLVMIDCGSSPLVRLSRAGLDKHHLTDLILTHFHPDHVSGAPSLLMESWLIGRQSPLRIHGTTHVIERLTKLLDLYSWKGWPNMYPVEFQLIVEEEMTQVINDGDMRIFASPVNHMIPNIGLRIESPQTGAALAYSSDTEPCESVATLARYAKYLLHETAGAFHGHTSAGQAGEIAHQAQAEHLYLVHYDPRLPSPGQLVEEARQTFTGSVTLAQDFMTIVF